ncbi:hypothetical protein BOTBODRAFT_177299 [Botryobasidium botryosum FD-172 SS1]|uniref:F-box domain-containing protein n=1 Tax=Botryobasidium botryosum (strain FD-172 SS1) TaxID=930990 RepID=A0A067MHU6_BOTB1|nr:hypothetical protein BOTBODRAFT_177299 [Botryobasidium botryosum FD-172 SS1]
MMVQVPAFITARQRRYQAAPINRLPDEILIQIFSSFPLLPEDILGHRTSYAVLVSGICHRWRQLATQTGSLWSTIEFNRHITTEGYRLPNYDGILDVARLYLRRSNDCGLRIIFGNIRHMPRELFTAAVDLVLSAFSRWEVLEIHGLYCQEYQIQRVLSGFLDCCVRNPSQSLRLRSFHLECVNQEIAELETIVLRVLAIAPIRSLTLRSIKPNLPLSAVQSLTHLSLQRCMDTISITLMDLDTLLRQCTRLRSIKFEHVGIHDGSLPGIMSAKITLPHLEEMVLVQAVPNPIQTHIYQNVVAPSLQSFAMLVAETCASSDEAQELEYDAMVSFLSTTPSIRSFRHAHLPDPHLENALRALPQLTTLAFGFSWHERRWTVTKATYAPPPLDVCPRLSEYQINASEYGLIGLPEFIALKHFIEARSALPGVVPLRALTIKCDLRMLREDHGEKELALRQWFGTRVELVWEHVEVGLGAKKISALADFSTKSKPREVGAHARRSGPEDLRVTVVRVSFLCAERHLRLAPPLHNLEDLKLNVMVKNGGSTID